ncbi:ankyrin repeat-containing domain protein [Aspergillus arachidicola]|uniref:Ankyrin repeat-containing domain protein n=1 Tax=Aspergillus arachidicola TaxID=656916 RepID=A0A2G7FJP0_9EURO|nr:ankyrin repeat-containing domain protein [Aspergillus arachidicola]PIG80021.1 hypothetical protein AARAC_005189 [Aspergillus arachidicola]
MPQDMLLRGADVNACMIGLSNRKSALHLAADAGHTDMVTFLLGAGADANGMENRNKTFETRLHLAAEKGHVPAVRALIDSGADIARQMSWEKRTALDLAVQNGHLEVTRQTAAFRSSANERTQETKFQERPAVHPSGSRIGSYTGVSWPHFTELLN